MNKIYILTAIFSLSLLFPACNQDNIREVYESENLNYVSFGNKTLIVEVNTDNIVSVPVYRESTSVNTVKVTPVKISDALSIPSQTISFADGSKEGVLQIVCDLENMDFVSKYTAKLSIAEGNVVGTHGIGEMDVTISRKLSWTTLTQPSIFTSEAFGGEWEVEIVKADQANFFILKNLYEENLDVRVDVDNTGKATVASQKAWTHATYGYVSVRGSGIMQDGVVYMDLEHYVSAGSFGSFAESFTIPAN
ncbi:MAG: hypothetical protein RR202_06360 [Bacteroidales bacterium]